MTGYSGTDLVLYADTSDSSGQELTKIGGQRNVQIQENNSRIALNTKDTGRVEDHIPGRGTRTISLDGLVLASDAGLDALKDAIRNGTAIEVAKYKSGVKVEQATAYVYGRTEQFPDNAESTVSVQIELIEEWA